MVASLTWKLQKKKAKKDRKERKKDKKEKEKTCSGCGVDKQQQQHTDKRRHKDKRHRGHGKEKEHRKKRGNDIEQLEKSSLTEEPGHPVGSQNSCDSSGSTVNHNKRYRTSASFIGMESSGSTAKLVLPCQTFKHELTEQLGSPTRNLIQEQNLAAYKPLEVVPICSTSATDSESVVRRSEREVSHQSLMASRSTGPQSLETSPPSVFRPSPNELKFKDLVVNWVPPPYCSEIPEYDEHEWWFSRNQNRGTKRIKAVADSSSCGASAPWSRACLLPEVDLYALPFTMPL